MICLLFSLSRPATSFAWFSSPLKTFKHIIWKFYKWHIIIGIVMVFVVIGLVIFIYSAPVNFPLPSLPPSLPLPLSPSFTPSLPFLSPRSLSPSLPPELSPSIVFRMIYKPVCFFFFLEFHCRTVSASIDTLLKLLVMDEI